MIRFRCSLPLVLIIVGACSSSGGGDVMIRSEYGPSAFAGFGKTFRWADFNPVYGDRAVHDSALEQLIKDLITEQLTSRGYELRAIRSDFLVTYELGTERITEAEPEYAKNFGMPAEPSTWLEGSLTILLVDPETKHLKWRGMIAKEVFEDTTPTEARETLRTLLDQVFVKFPRQGEDP